MLLISVGPFTATAPPVGTAALLRGKVLVVDELALLVAIETLSPGVTTRNPNDKIFERLLLPLPCAKCAFGCLWPLFTAFEPDVSMKR